MADAWEQAQLIADGFLHVCVEHDLYDGPRAGLVDADSAPLYFYCPNWTRDEYLVWPAAPEAVPLEREQWLIVVRRYQRHETGPRPTLGDPRYAELETLLTPYRQAPDDARLCLAEWRFDDGERYREDGTDNWVRWSLLRR